MPYYAIQHKRGGCTSGVPACAQASSFNACLVVLARQAMGTWTLSEIFRLALKPARAVADGAKVAVKVVDKDAIKVVVKVTM